MSPGPCGDLLLFSSLSLADQGTGDGGSFLPCACGPAAHCRSVHAPAGCCHSSGVQGSANTWHHDSRTNHDLTPLKDAWGLNERLKGGRNLATCAAVVKVRKRESIKAGPTIISLKKNERGHCSAPQHQKVKEAPTDAI